MTEQRLAEIEVADAEGLGWAGIHRSELLEEVRRLRKLGLEQLDSWRDVSKFIIPHSVALNSEYNRRRAEWLGEEKTNG